MAELRSQQDVYDVTSAGMSAVRGRERFRIWGRGRVKKSSDRERERNRHSQWGRESYETPGRDVEIDRDKDRKERYETHEIGLKKGGGEVKSKEISAIRKRKR